MSLFGEIDPRTLADRNRLALRNDLELRPQRLRRRRGPTINASATDSEARELLLLDLLAEGSSPAEAAATLLDRDIASGSYAEGSRELETAFEHYRDEAERVRARAQQTAEGLFRINTLIGREHRPPAHAINHGHPFSEAT
jgi:hypothetical protein